MKMPKHEVALFHELLDLKGETRQMDELTSLELNKFLSEFAKKKTTRNASLIPQGHSPLALSAIKKKKPMDFSEGGGTGG